MPYFEEYVPFAEQTKRKLFYDLWGRPTLEYSPTCENPIDDAIKLLDDMSDLNYDTESLNLAVWITSASIAGFALIYMCFNCFCYMRAWKNLNPCCGNPHCITINRIMYHSYMLCGAIGILSVESINFG